MFLFLDEACRLFRSEIFRYVQQTFNKNINGEGEKNRDREKWGAWERQANAAKVNDDLILVKTVWVLTV